MSTSTVSLPRERCFACGRVLGVRPLLVDTRDAQTVFVGAECAKQITASGNEGWQPPRGGPRLYLMGETTNPN
jgi:hypothetical protein